MTNPEMLFPHQPEVDENAEDEAVDILRQIYLDVFGNASAEDIPPGISIEEALGIFFTAWYDDPEKSDDPEAYLQGLSFLE